jgi:hypothetical protein
MPPPPPPRRHKSALAQLTQDVERGSAYVEEANRLGAVAVLTRLLSQARECGVSPLPARLGPQPFMPWLLAPR